MFINDIICHLLNAYHIAGTALSTIHLTPLPSEGTRMGIPLTQIRELV